MQLAQGEREMPLKMDEQPQNPAGPDARLVLLGAFSLNCGGSGIEIAAKKSRALLAILALSPNQQATRERICGLLWSDRGEEQARSSLRQALAVLRKELGPLAAEALVTRDDILALRPEAAEVDALRLLQLASGDADALRQAARLYGGQLLADTSVRDPGFEDWLASERRRFTDVAIAVLEKLSGLETGTAAIAAAKRLLELDPLREASHRALIKALAAAGETALALQQYEACRSSLKAEFGVEPTMETAQLRNEIFKTPPGPVQSKPAERPPSAPLNAKPKNSLAVLPFTNLSSDTEQQYFTDGLTEDLITDLSKVRGLFVIAAHSVFRYRGGGVDSAGAAQALGVRYVVQGSARKIGGGLRFNAQLVDTDTGTVLWADRYDRDISTIHDLQVEIAAQIASAVLGPGPVPVQPERYKSPSLEAFDFCMQGRKAWRLSDAMGVETVRLFEKVIELDPHYSEAYRWLAMGQCLSWLHYGQPMHPARELAVANARKAVALDPLDSAAHSVLAEVILSEHLLEESAAEFQMALHLNPNDADAWNLLSDLKVMQGNGREAVACCERSLQLNPHPLAYYFWLYGQAQFAAGEYEAAVHTLRRDETYRTGSRRILAASLAMLGQLEEAREEGRLFMAGSPYFTISYWMETQPFRDLAMRDRFIEAYRMAGLPD